LFVILTADEVTGKMPVPHEYRYFCVFSTAHELLLNLLNRDYVKKS